MLFLTARDQLHDVLSGFAAGADDYLAKPFHVSELRGPAAARCSAAARRAPRRRRRPACPSTRPTHALLGPAGPAAAHPDRVPAARRADGRARGGRPPPATCSLAGWPDGAIVADNTLDQYVARLRRKVERRRGRRPAIDTAHGVGYRFT